MSSNIHSTCKTSKINFFAWSIWLTAGLFYMYEFIHRVSPNVMVPELMQDFNVSKQALGNLSAYYYYSYALAQIPIGIILDRYSTRYSLMFAALLISIGSFILSNTYDVNIANFSRIIIGFGSAFSFVACIRLAANWFPKRKLGLVIGLTNLLGVIGAILAGRPLAQLVEDTSWRTSIHYLGIIGLVFVFMIWLIVRDYSNKNTSTSRVLQNNFTCCIKHLKEIAVNKQIWLIALFGSLMVAPIASYAELWGVTYLISKYDISKPIAAQVVAFTFVGIAFGGPINGWISDLIQRRKPVMLVGFIGATLSFAAIVYLSNVSTSHITVLHIVFGFFTSSMLLCFSLNTEITAISIRGVVIGFTNTLIMGISVLFQPLVGFILDFLAFKSTNSKIYLTSSYKTAFLPLLLCLFTAGLILIFVKEPSTTN